MSGVTNLDSRIRRRIAERAIEAKYARREAKLLRQFEKRETRARAEYDRQVKAAWAEYLLKLARTQAVRVRHLEHFAATWRQKDRQV